MIGTHIHVKEINVGLSYFHVEISVPVINCEPIECCVMSLINSSIRNVLQLERVCSLASRYIGRPIQATGPAPSLLSRSLELDMSTYPSHFEESMNNCTKMIPVPIMPENSSHFSGGGLVILEEEKSLAMKVAMSSMDELMKMCLTGEPLWIRMNGCEREVLNVEEHKNMFPWPMSLNQHPSDQLRTEASRETAVVIMNSITLVDAFLDAVSYSTSLKHF